MELGHQQLQVLGDLDLAKIGLIRRKQRKQMPLEVKVQHIMATPTNLMLDILGMDRQDITHPKSKVPTTVQIMATMVQAHKDP